MLAVSYVHWVKYIYLSHDLGIKCKIVCLFLSRLLWSLSRMPSGMPPMMSTTSCSFTGISRLLPKKKHCYLSDPRERLVDRISQLIWVRTSIQIWVLIKVPMWVSAYKWKGTGSWESLGASWRKAPRVDPGSIPIHRLTSVKIGSIFATL